jgi:SNF2 family DNA or RNA helicase
MGLGKTLQSIALVWTMLKQVRRGGACVASNVHRMSIGCTVYGEDVNPVFVLSVFFFPVESICINLHQFASICINLHQQGPMGKATANQAVIVTPSSLVMNWAAEFKKWLGNERCRPIAVNKSGKAAKEQVEDFVAGRGTMAPVLIISYEM